jgi:hypothetical protein
MRTFVASDIKCAVPDAQAIGRVAEHGDWDGDASGARRHHPEPDLSGYHQALDLPAISQTDRLPLVKRFFSKFATSPQSTS